MARRGPDDKGTWLSPHAAIGHRRLSIIDLPGVHGESERLQVHRGLDAKRLLDDHRLGAGAQSAEQGADQLVVGQHVGVDQIGGEIVRRVGSLVRDQLARSWATTTQPRMFPGSSTMAMPSANCPIYSDSSRQHTQR